MKSEPSLSSERLVPISLEISESAARALHNAAKREGLTPEELAGKIIAAFPSPESPAKMGP